MVNRGQAKGHDMGQHRTADSTGDRQDREHDRTGQDRGHDGGCDRTGQGTGHGTEDRKRP